MCSGALCGAEARPSYIPLLCGARHGALHGAGCPLLFVGWGKCVTTLLRLSYLERWKHLCRGTQVAAAAAAASCWWPRMQDSCQSTLGTWLEGLTSLLPPAVQAAAHSGESCPLPAGQPEFYLVFPHVPLAHWAADLTLNFRAGLDWCNPNSLATSWLGNSGVHRPAVCSGMGVCKPEADSG